MREMPANRLNPKIKNVWRINDAIWIALCFLLCFVPFAIVAAVEPDAGWSLVVLGVIAVLFEEAEVLRDRAAELARIAREDV